MKNTLKLVLLALVIIFPSTAQVPPPVTTVYDPKGMVEWGKMIEILDETKKTYEKLSNSTEFVKGVVEKTKTFKRLIELLEKLTCATDKMEILVRAQDRLQFCDKSLEIDVTLLQLEHISTKMMILTQAIAMSKSESIENLDDLVDLVEAAIARVNGINREMVLNFQKLNQRLLMRKQIETNNTMTYNANI